MGHSRIPGRSKASKAIRLWDAGYRRRVARYHVVLATQPEFLELHRAPEVHHQDLLSIFGRSPATPNPPAIACHQLDALLQLAAGRGGYPAWRAPSKHLVEVVFVRPMRIARLASQHAPPSHREPESPAHSIEGLLRVRRPSYPGSAPRLRACRGDSDEADAPPRDALHGSRRDQDALCTSAEGGPLRRSGPCDVAVAL